MPPVLLVDDDPAVRRPIARFLVFEGFSVVEANNFQEALTTSGPAPAPASSCSTCGCR